MVSRMQHDQVTAARREATAEYDEGLRQHMLKVYNYLAGGLALSAVVALAVINTPLLGLFYTVQGGQVVGMSLLGMIAMFAPLVMIVVAMFGLRNASLGATQAFYWAFVAVMGVGLSVTLLAYTGESVVRVLFITAASFAGLSLFGYTTKKSLAGFGSFLFMGLIGLILASVVNIFLQSSAMQFVIAAAGVLIFAGLIAWETQRIKEEYSASWGEEANAKSAVWGALHLYISFINLFRFLLYFLGQQR